MLGFTMESQTQVWSLAQTTASKWSKDTGLEFEKPTKVLRRLPVSDGTPGGPKSFGKSLVLLLSL